MVEWKVQIFLSVGQTLVIVGIECFELLYSNSGQIQDVVGLIWVIEYAAICGLRRVAFEVRSHIGRFGELVESVCEYVAEQFDFILEFNTSAVFP